MIRNAKAKGTRAEHRSARLLEAAGYRVTAPPTKDERVGMRAWAVADIGICESNGRSPDLSIGDKILRLLSDLERVEADLQQATSLLAQDERMREDFITRIDRLAADLQIEQQQHAIARAELDEATHALQRIAEDVLPDPVKYSDISPHAVVLGFIRGWLAAKAEIARLRDIIAPGDAAAYEQGMAALQARLARVVEIVNTERSGGGDVWSIRFVEAILAAAKGDEPEIVQANWDL